MESAVPLIKDVAIYLRKSRGESETDLVKQRTVLTELCSQNQWKFVEYSEVASGDSLAMRPQMRQLLVDVQAGLYDAVLVVDLDRLGRGDMEEQARIKNILRMAGVVLVTEKSVYILDNEDHDFTIDIRGLLARQEYKQIVKRLMRGKKVGSKLGNWTNGTPPFPYEYERWRDKFNEKGLVVNDAKLPTYLLIKEMFIVDFLTPRQIAVKLNKKGIPSPRGGAWSAMTVQRLMQDETHLGRIVANKTRGDGHGVKKPSAKPFQRIPSSEWLRVEGCHEAIKTEAEHDQILGLSAGRVLGVTRNRQPVRALSGLIRCGVCGKTMQFEPIREGHGVAERVKRCAGVDHLGVKCSNRGGSLDRLIKTLDQELRQWEEQLIVNLKEGNANNQGEVLAIRVAELEKEIKKQEKQLDFIFEQYEQQIYGTDVFKARKAKAEAKLQKLQETLENYQVQIRGLERRSDEERLARVRGYFSNLMGATTEAARNRLLKTVLSGIFWTRQSDEISIQIQYL